MPDLAAQLLGLPHWLLALGLALLAALLLALGWRLRRAWMALRLGRSKRRGDRGERDAKELLARGGYRIVSSQAVARGRLLVDGELVEFDVRLDYLVERDGATSLAEVKTGAAASIATRATRRQLLEYAYLLDVDHVLLVDMDARRILRVDFPGAGAARCALG